MKILSPNKNGLILIPAKVRKDFHIDDKTAFLFEVKDGTFTYTPVELKPKKNKKLKQTSQRKKQYTFQDLKKAMFTTEKPIKNLSKDIDKILYS